MTKILAFCARIGFVAIALLTLIHIGNLITPSPVSIQRIASGRLQQYSTPDIEALALNIYHETRGLAGKNNVGWRSVAGVVFNRLEDKRFPKTIPEIVFEKNQKKGRCAFSWYCDGLSDVPRDTKLYQKIYHESEKYLAEYRAGTWKDPTRGAHSYHANTVKPNRYFKKLDFVIAVIEGKMAHFFYKDS